MQSCVDHLLAERGLDAFGAPAGTPYPRGPPVDPDGLERYGWVLDRHPEIATRCLASPPFR